MTLLVLMYHRALVDRHGNAAAMLDAHFAHIARTSACILPGEPLQRERLNICLSFDDAYYDFRALVYPLLEKHGLRALLAVPTGLVPERVNAMPAARLALSSYDAYAYPEKGGLCTWDELRQLAASGRVAFAAHGRTHVRLDNGHADLAREIVEPRDMLQQRLGVPVDSFVYPFGRFHRAAQALTRQHYRHVFRIGQADNTSWQAPILYRIDADRMPAPDALFSRRCRLRYRANALWNRLRGR
jgi:peptidoglycan/xylan/chitin deacetylase (PgdA/CDA1 family)